ncbi:MAG: zinc ribbon domain-containing protein [Oscillospiraceae bacterium]|nr:zinc ribbon domain-containing protein [Oscillospiraceae bacterium]
MRCLGCGAELGEGARFCEACGAQTVTEQEAVRARRERDANAHADRGVGGSVWITVAMAAFALAFAAFIGFDEGEARVATVTAIMFAAVMTGFKWLFEVRAQIRRKARRPGGG